MSVKTPKGTEVKAREKNQVSPTTKVVQISECSILKGKYTFYVLLRGVFLSTMLHSSVSIQTFHSHSSLSAPSELNSVFILCKNVSHSTVSFAG